MDEGGAEEVEPEMELPKTKEMVQEPKRVVITKQEFKGDTNGVSSK